MAEGEYRRLTCTVNACGGTHKAHGYCLRHYRQHQRGGIKQDATVCAHCSAPFQPPHVGAIYCSKRCKLQAWRTANPERNDRYVPTVCLYVAKVCDGCGLAWGSRRNWDRCQECRRQAELLAARTAARAWGEAQHRAAARVVVCEGCGLAFCPTYGAQGVSRRCVPCSEARARKAKAESGGSNVQRAKRAGVPYRYFAERKVMERDGWTCQLCGVATPREARGSTRPDAPEFDHCIPLALGGPHVPENGQCLCRTCNNTKGDNWCDKSVARALERGVALPDRARRRAQGRLIGQTPETIDATSIEAPAPA